MATESLSLPQQRFFIMSLRECSVSWYQRLEGLKELTLPSVQATKTPEICMCFQLGSDPIREPGRDICRSLLTLGLLGKLGVVHLEFHILLCLIISVSLGNQ